MVLVRRRVQLALLAVVLGLGVCALPAAAAAKPHGLAHPKRCNGAKRLCKRSLDQVVLAGAHNAMSAQELGFLLPNQTQAIPGQLDLGVRALLIDTHYGRLQADGTVRTDDDGDVETGARGTYLCHEYCEIGATPLAPALRRIRRWLRHNPAEVLVIENEDYISNNDFVAAMSKSGLLDYVYRGPRSPWPSLRKMIRKGHRVVMLADNDKAIDPAWYRPTYEGLLQETPYTFNPPSKLTDPANWPASCAPNRGGLSGSLFLMNHWSPSVAPAVPDPAASAAVNSYDVIGGRASECAAVRGRYPNIIAVDQVGYGDLFEVVDRLNRLPAAKIHPPGT